MSKIPEHAVENVTAPMEAEPLASTGDDVHVLSDDERRLIQEARDELDRGEVATPAEVRATYDKYRA